MDICTPYLYEQLRGTGYKRPIQTGLDIGAFLSMKTSSLIEKKYFTFITHRSVNLGFGLLVAEGVTVPLTIQP
jgi:hypothetical protein